MYIRVDVCRHTLGQLYIALRREQTNLVTSCLIAMLLEPLQGGQSGPLGESLRSYTAVAGNMLCTIHGPVTNPGRGAGILRFNQRSRENGDGTAYFENETDTPRP